MIRYVVIVVLTLYLLTAYGLGLHQYGIVIEQQKTIRELRGKIVDYMLNYVPKPPVEIYMGELEFDPASDNTTEGIY